MKTLKKLPTTQGWRWYKNDWATSNAPWVPARIEYHAGRGLEFCSWNDSVHFSHGWSMLSASKPSEWGEPIGNRNKASKPTPIPYVLTDVLHPQCKDCDHNGCSTCIEGDEWRAK